MADCTVPKCRKVQAGLYVCECGEERVRIIRARDGWRAKPWANGEPGSTFPTLALAKAWAVCWLEEYA